MPRSKTGQFDTLLRVRQRLEDLKAMALAESRRELHHARSQRDGIAAEQRRALEMAGSAAQAQFDASDVRRYYQHERHLAQLAVEKDAEIHALEGTIELRRAALEKALRDKRVVERLRERRLAAHLKEVRRKEQQMLDEIALNYSTLRTGFPQGAEPGEDA